MTPRDRDLRLLPAGKAGWPFSSARRPGALVSTVQGPSSIGVTPGPDLALPGDLVTDLNLPGIGLSGRGMASAPRGCSCWRLRLSGVMASVPSSSARGRPRSAVLAYSCGTLLLAPAVRVGLERLGLEAEEEAQVAQAGKLSVQPCSSGEATIWDSRAVRPCSSGEVAIWDPRSGA